MSYWAQVASAGAKNYLKGGRPPVDWRGTGSAVDLIERVRVRHGRATLPSNSWVSLAEREGRGGLS